MRASRNLILIAALAFFCANVQGQIPAGSSTRSIPEEVEKLDARVAQVINLAEARFREGELLLKAGEREHARDKFDKAVETVLESGMNIQTSSRLNNYYSILVEKIYRLEVPSQNSPREEVSRNVDGLFPGNEKQVAGFKEQKNQPSDSDVLSRPSPYSITGINSKCSEDIAKTFQLRGLRFGMKTAEVISKISGLKVPTSDEFGHAMAPIKLAALARINPTFKGLMGGAFEFVDGKLSSMFLVYDDSVNWNGPDEFLARVSESLSLSDYWQTNPVNPRLKSTQCRNLQFTGGFQFIGGESRPFLMVRDTNADSLVTNRETEKQRLKLEKEEERRRNFKP
jgi:hypothetical protein